MRYLLDVVLRKETGEECNSLTCNFDSEAQANDAMNRAFEAASELEPDSVITNVELNDGGELSDDDKEFQE